MQIDNTGFKNFRTDASCLIRPQSLIGEKYVDCTPTQPRAPGTPPPPSLEKIPDGQPGSGAVPAPAREQRQDRRSRPGPEHPAAALPRPLPAHPERSRRRPRGPWRGPRRGRSTAPTPRCARQTACSRSWPSRTSSWQAWPPTATGPAAARREPRPHHRLLPQRGDRGPGLGRARPRARGGPAEVPGDAAPGPADDERS